MQHGFMRRKSTTTQLLEVYHNIPENVAGGKEVDVIYLDLTKAFDKVPHNTVLKTREFWYSGFSPFVVSQLPN